MKRYIINIVALIYAISCVGQVYTVPSVVNSPMDETFYVYFDATQGDKGMVGAETCYAHTGLLTTKSIKSSDWKYYPDYGDNSEKYKMQQVSENLWSLEIVGGIKNYYGISDEECVTHMAFVFRNEDLSRRGAGVNSEDIFIKLEMSKYYLNKDDAIFNQDETILYKYTGNSTSYKIPNTVSIIADNAFYDCSSLTSLTIPNSVKSIGSSAFSYDLHKVNYLGSIDEWVGINFKQRESNPIYYAGNLYIDDELLTDVKITYADSIKKYAFYNCRSINSVEIGNSVTSIGDYAFYGCSGLTKVNYLGTVDEWMKIDFNGYDSNPTYYAKDLYINNELLTDVKIISVDSIKNYAFCNSIKSVEIGNNVKSIGANAFYDCSGLTKVNYLGTIDEWVKIDFKNSYSNPTSYAKDLYINDELLTDVKITSADSIKDYAFFYCQSIKSVEIGKSVRYVGNSAFGGCPLTYFTIGQEVTEIGQSAFKGHKLKFIEIPDKVETIGGCALLGENVKSIKLGKSVKEMGPSTYDKSGMPPLYAPSYYWSLSEIIVSPENKLFSSYDGILYDKNRTTLITCPPTKTECIIPEGVEVIGEHSFHENYNLKCLTIPNSVTSIGGGAFYLCSSLTSVTIPNSVTSIGSSAFFGCSGLTSVTIPTSVTSIGSSAFYVCSGLTKVNYLGTVDKWVDFDFKNYASNPTYYANDLYINGELLTDVKITTADSIKDNAFYNCQSIKSVVIGDSVISIGSGAFYRCENLKTVYNCSSLDIVKGSTKHAYVAFYAEEVINGCSVGDFIVNYEDEIIEYIGDTTINKIEIPEFVTGINADVFTSCANIDTIVWNAINCADFTETTAPFNAQAAQIKSVIFGNDVEYIPAYLCSDMTLLTEISIPEKVNSIGENAFVGCSRLRYITSYPTLVPLAKVNSFNSYSAYLYIPCDYYDYYYLDDVFGKFKEIKCISAEEVEGSDKVEIEVDSNNNATIIWPSTGNASSYELVISKNGEVFCTLLFNENGQLTSIDFGNRSASVGFQFTVTGLDGASKYSYSIVAKDEKGNELESYNGTFTTNGYSEVTAILETLADANITVSGGTISADTDFTIYNTIGQNVNAYNGSLQPGVYIVNIGDDIAKVMVK